MKRIILAIVAGLIFCACADGSGPGDKKKNTEITDEQDGDETQDKTEQTITLEAKYLPPNLPDMNDQNQ